MIFDYYIVPEDLWTKEYSETGPFSIAGQGSSGDYKDIILHFEDEYAIFAMEKQCMKNARDGW